MEPSQTSQNVFNQHVYRVRFRQGEVILLEGSIDAHFYIVEKGQIQIFTKSLDGKRINICQVGEGESFGEFAMLGNQPRTASVEALTDVILIRISEIGFEKLISELPHWASSMLRTFICRFQLLNDRIKEIESETLSIK